MCIFRSLCAYHNQMGKLMPINSKQKGARGERDFCKFLNGFGMEAIRTAQHCGKDGGEPDIKCADLDQFHFEVKMSGTSDIYGYLAQAERDANEDRYPVVAYRRSSVTHQGLPWVSMMYARDFIILAQKAQKYDLMTQHGECDDVEMPSSAIKLKSHNIDPMTLMDFHSNLDEYEQMLN